MRLRQLATVDPDYDIFLLTVDYFRLAVTGCNQVIFLAEGL